MDDFLLEIDPSYERANWDSNPFCEVVKTLNSHSVFKPGVLPVINILYNLQHLGRFDPSPPKPKRDSNESPHSLPHLMKVFEPGFKDLIIFRLKGCHELEVDKILFCVFHSLQECCF